jgi:hypothetical protein
MSLHYPQARLLKVSAAKVSEVRRMSATTAGLHL